MNIGAMLCCAGIGVAASYFVSLRAQETTIRVPAPARVEEIARWIPARPVGLGFPAAERAAWQEVGKQFPLALVIAEAERLAREASPSLTDEMYLIYTHQGTRDEYHEPYRERLARLKFFALAEALEYRGRFLGAIARELDTLSSEVTWVMPASDPELLNLRGKRIDVELGASLRGWTIATILYWHGGRLDPEVVRRTLAELRRRVIMPYLAAIRDPVKSPGFWWITASNNWNPVCHAGIIGAALGMGWERNETAEIIAAAEANLPFYLGGFAGDGYCTEGVGYWNYGFGAYVVLAELLATATQSRLRLLDEPQTRAIAAFPEKVEILPGIFPSFSDVDFGARPSSAVSAMAERRFAGGTAPLLPRAVTIDEIRRLQLHDIAARAFAARDYSGSQTAAPIAPIEQRSWFPQTQVLIVRDGQGFGAAMKGGHNDENHNHNDLGSYLVAVGQGVPLVDPGREIYTKRTFGADRYKSAINNSYGHPVPLVAGQLQSPGRAHEATVLEARFDSGADRLVLDLTKGYAVKPLIRLIRTFDFKRASPSSLTVIDTVEYDTPELFGTALITFERHEQTSPGELTIGQGASAVRVTVTAEGAGLEFRPEILDERLPGGRKPVRLGFDLKTPVRKGSIRVVIAPSGNR